MILVLLQNGWAKDQRSAAWMAAKRDNWIYALAQCRSGRRLEIMLGEECWGDASGFWFDNTTPEFAIGSSAGKIKPDLDYVRGVLAKVNPERVVACGAQAEAVAIGLWGGPLLVVPHPANRSLTDELYRVAGKMLREPGRRALRQQPGRVEVVDLDTDPKARILRLALKAGDESPPADRQGV